MAAGICPALRALAGWVCELRGMLLWWQHIGTMGRRSSGAFEEAVRAAVGTGAARLSVLP